MKKILWLLLLLSLPIIVEARVSYDLTNFLVDATILDNGDLQVKELIVLDGNFNGYWINIPYRNPVLEYHTPINFAADAIYNGSGISNVKLFAKKIDEEISFDTFDEEFVTLTRSYYEEDAQNGNYVESSIQNGKSYKMYYKAENEKVAFLIEYTLEDMVVLHEDVAELYFAILSEDFEDSIEDLQIRVNLPKEDSSNNFRIWTHGDLTANIDFLNRSSFLTTVKKTYANTAIDVRTTFDASLMNRSLVRKTTEEKALDQIIAVEEERAQAANQARETAKKNMTITYIICAIYIVIIISWWIYVYIRFDREYKSTFTLKYNREFIEDYNVEVVDYLMNHNITPNAMSASILNLIYKKNIKVEEIPSEKKKKEKNYRFSLINRDKASDTEDVLLDFLFETVGKDNTFTTEELKKYASGTTTFGNFQKSYTNWQNCARKDGERQNFFEKNGLPIVSSIFLLLIALIIVCYVSYLDVYSVMVIIVMTLSLVFLIYALFIRKRTKKGNEDYVRWKAFKNFLEDFGRFDIKELPEIALWEKYLVYATVFGLADQVEKAMNVKISELPEGTMSMYYPSYVDFHIAHMVSHSINNSFTSNQTAISNSRIASSRGSSGSGFGGGGSLGGGFGGGGGVSGGGF